MIPKRIELKGFTPVAGKKTYICPICSKRTGKFTDHLTKDHGIQLKDLIIKLNVTTIDSQKCEYCKVNPKLLVIKSANHSYLAPYCDSRKCLSKHKILLNSEVIKDGKTRLELKNEKTLAKLEVVNPETGLTRKQESIIRMNATKHEIGDDGLTGYQRSIRKQIRTMRSDVDEDGKNAYQRAQKHATKTKKSKVIDGKDVFTIASEKRRSTLRKLGKWAEVYSKTSGSLSKTLLNMSPEKVEQRLIRSLNKFTTKRYRNTELMYQSSHERRFLDRLRLDGKLDSVINAPTISGYYQRRRYYPDFYIPKTNTIVEIKSTAVMVFRQSPEEVFNKFKRTLELGYNILFVLDLKEFRFNEISELEEFFSQY